MPGLPVALALLAQTATADATGNASAAPTQATYGPVPPPAPKPASAPATTPGPDCSEVRQNSNSREIVICAQRTDGYRLNRDIMEARREKRRGDAGAPHNPHEAFKPNDCLTVGPMGCRGGAMINILSAAAIAAEMARRLSNGEEIGSMFKTTPGLSEYQLYVEAKKRREAEEAAKVAKAKAAAMVAKADAAKAVEAQAKPH